MFDDFDIYGIGIGPDYANVCPMCDDEGVDA